jgi:hypothetical protein
MYVNGKMIPMEPIPEMGEEAIKENAGGIELKYYIFNILL